MLTCLLCAFPFYFQSPSFSSVSLAGVLNVPSDDVAGSSSGILRHEIGRLMCQDIALRLSAILPLMLSCADLGDDSGL